jgi:hypothetical protein
MVKHSVCTLSLDMSASNATVHVVTRHSLRRGCEVIEFRGYKIASVEL